VNWYDCNNMLKARAGRQLNNYQLTDSGQLLETYDANVNNGYFLGAGETAPWQAEPLHPKERVGPQEEMKLRFFARCQIADPILYLKLDNRWRWRGQLPTPLAVNLGKLGKGRHKVEIKMTDRQNRQLASQEFLLSCP
jgi:hypothetical protein